MEKDTAESFLLRMHELINLGKRQFISRTRNGKNATQQLADLGLSSVEEVWSCVLDLNESHYFSGPDYDRRDGADSPLVIWVFKMDVNDNMTYIKLKDDTANRGCVCMSFHIDEP